MSRPSNNVLSWKDGKNKTKQTISAIWLTSSHRAEDRVCTFKPSWAELFLNLSSCLESIRLRNDHVKFWKCQCPGLPSIYSKLIDLRRPKHLHFLRIALVTLWCLKQICETSSVWRETIHSFKESRFQMFNTKKNGKPVCEMRRY